MRLPTTPPIMRRSLSACLSFLFALASPVVTAGAQTTTAPTDSALVRRIKSDVVDSLALNPKLNLRSRRAMARIVARGDSITRNAVDTVRRVDTVYVTKPDTATSPDTTVIVVKPPVDTTTPLPPPTPVLYTHPFAPPANGAMLPEFPRAQVDVRYPTILRRIPVVSMQAALDTARAGDELLCAVGSVHRNIRPGPTARTGYVVIRTNVSDAALGTARMTRARADSLNLCTITTATTDAPIHFGSGSGWVRLHGVRVSTTSPVNNALVRVGMNESVLSQLPTHVVVDLSVLDGGTNDVRRCVAIGGAHEAVMRSSLLNCHSNLGDSQGVWGSNSAGPIRIEDNTMQGGHQCILIGGADPAIVGQVPSDIVFRRNDCTRPLAWQGVWQTKTNVEFKLGRRLLIEGNAICHTWKDAQTGYAILLKTENQDGGTGDWSETSDVTVRYNRICGAAGAINLSALPQGPGVPMSRIAIYGNVADSIGIGPYVGDTGDALQIAGVADVVFQDNWIRNPTGRSCIYSMNPSVRFVGRGIVCGGEYGIRGENGIAFTLPGAILTNNTVLSWGTTFANWPAMPVDSTRDAILKGVQVTP